MKVKTKRLIRFLPIVGCIATGLIYAGIGVVAILSFLRIKHGGADEASLFAFLNDFLVGKAFVWIILMGTVAYIAWRIYETIKDPYKYGSDPKGLARRTGIALSTIADAFIVFSAIQAILGTGNIQEDGQPAALRQTVAGLLLENWGDLLIISVGVVVCITAVIQFFYGISQGYKERLAIGHFSPFIKSSIHFLAWVGYLARGIILGIIGFFFIKAGFADNARYVVNTDKAFDFIGDDVGHVFFILVALGTICYGLFMFTLGFTYKAGKSQLRPKT